MGESSSRVTEEQCELATKLANLSRGLNYGPDYANCGERCRCDGFDRPFSLVPGSGGVGFPRKSVFVGFFSPALNFACLPDAPRPAKAASSGCETKKGARSPAERQARFVLGDPERVCGPWPGPFLEPSLQSFTRAPGRISRFRNPLYISTGAIGALHELWRILHANQPPNAEREQIRANAPNAERAKLLTAANSAAWEKAALTLGHATRLQRLSDSRKTTGGRIGEVDAYWLAAHRNLDRAPRPPASFNLAHGAS